MQKQNISLSIFLELVSSKAEITPLHISLYTVIYENFTRNKCISPFNVNRRELMRLSHIRSKATYHKCLNDLIKLGFVSYSPSYNPYTGSEIKLITHK